MNRDQMTTFCRDQSALDDSDVSSATLLSLLQEAWERTLAHSETWPFHEARWERTVPAGTGEVDVPSDLIRFASVIRHDPAVRLRRVQLDVAEVEFDNAIGPAEYFAEWGDVLHLFPTDPQERAITIRGWRAGNPSWLSSPTVQCDADSRLHIPICYHAISNMFAAIEEFESSDFYFRSWSNSVDEFKKQITRGQAYGELKLAEGPYGGGTFSPAAHGTWGA